MSADGGKTWEMNWVMRFERGKLPANLMVSLSNHEAAGLPRGVAFVHAFQITRLHHRASSDCRIAALRQQRTRDALSLE